MPAEECNNGKWKWGETGECKYETQQEAEQDNEDYRELIGTIISDGIELPLFDTIEEAENEAEKLGGQGYHEHTIDGKIYYMPFSSHEEAKEILKTEENKLDLKNKKIWEQKYNNIDMEKRIFNLESRIEKREDGREVVTGHASVYESKSENLGGFYEYIAKGVFTEDLINRSDVRALINHDPNLVLARSKNGEGTLKLTPDEKGLAYSYELPDLSYAKDLGVNLRNVNISQSSFAFVLKSDKSSSDDEANDIRTITGIDKLYDISSVVYPAYSQAESDLIVAQRGLALYKEQKENERQENDLIRRSLLKLKIELKKR